MRIVTDFQPLIFAVGLILIISGAAATKKCNLFKRSKPTLLEIRLQNNAEEDS